MKDIFMKNKHLYYIPFMLLVIIVTLSACTSSTTNPKKKPKSNNGTIDLTDWNFDSNGTLSLDGQWEFYWNERLDYDDYSKKSTVHTKNDITYIEIPSSWNKHEIDDTVPSGNGYATYRLTIKLDDKNIDYQLGLKIPRVFTSYILWLDDTVVASAGEVSETKDTAQPQYTPKTVIFKPDGNIVQLTMQVSNFSHRSGGMLESIEIGTSSQITNARENHIALELFLFGCLLIMGIYHLVIFMFRKKDPTPLFFSIYCIFIATRTLFTGEIFITQMFPNFNWEIQHKIQTLSFYIGVPVFMMLIKSIFPKDMPNIAVRSSQVAGALFGLLVLFTPARIFTIFNPAFQFITGVLIVFVVYSLIKACINRRRGSALITIGGIIFVVTAINDILFLSVPFNDYNIPILSTIITTNNLTSIGLVVLLFTQSVVLAMNSSKAFIQVEEMSDELVVTNKQKDELLISLEDKVKERTLELKKTNDDLSKAYQELYLSEKSRSNMITNMSHDLKTPMTFIQGYLEAILDGMIEDEDKDKYLRLMHDKILSIVDITNDLFDLCQLQSRQKGLNLQNISASDLVNNTQKKYKQDILNAGLTLKLEVDTSSIINIDINQMDRVFSNLIYNAIKYAPNSVITLGCTNSDGCVIFKVSDTGPGISEKDLPFIFDRFYTGSKSRNTALHSSGLGLSIVIEIVEYHGGSIWAESKLGEGTTYYFKIKEYVAEIS